MRVCVCGCACVCVVLTSVVGGGSWDRDRLLEAFVSPCVRFKRGFESEPTLHSGINYAVLLLAAGHQFDSSFELRKVGEETRPPQKPERSFCDLGRLWVTPTEVGGHVGGANGGAWWG